MRSQGTAQELEARRRLAVERVLAGYRRRAVAAFPGVSEGTVNRWMAAYRQGRQQPRGRQGQADAGGRPRKLTARQEQTVLRWVAKPPTSFGFSTDLWTSRRLAALIEQRWDVRFNANYLVEWLTARRHSPQKPAQPARERDEAAIARWAKEDWPRLQKKRAKRKRAKRMLTSS
jgi:transposase